MTSNSRSWRANRTALHPDAIFNMSGYQDSNLGPPAPKAGALTGLRYIPKTVIVRQMLILGFRGAKIYKINSKFKIQNSKFSFLSKKVLLYISLYIKIKTSQPKFGHRNILSVLPNTQKKSGLKPDFYIFC